jgi:hypothetical protein
MLARFLVLASVRRSVPLGVPSWFTMSNAAKPRRAGIFARALVLPLKASRDHQVDHHEAVAFEDEEDALAHALEAHHLPRDHLGHGGRHAPQDEGAREADRREGPSHDALLEGVEVGAQIG